MKFVCYSDWTQLPSGIDALFELGARQSIFLSRPWFENLLDNAFEESPSLRLACVIDGERVLAMLPLMQRDGDGLYALRHRYTTHFSPLLDELNQPEIVARLAEGLAALPNRSINLEPIGGDDAAMAALQTALEARGFECIRKFRFYNWIHRTGGENFAEYMAARPGSVRNTIARKQRKLAREQGYDIQLYSGLDAVQALGDYQMVYQASWKAHELFGEIIEGLVARFAQHDWVRLAMLNIRDKPAAAQLWFVAHGKASIFRLAYDETWKRYSPGSVLTQYLMTYVIDNDRVEEIDFLMGNEHYKQDWMSERRERYGMVCINPRPLKKGSAWRVKFSKTKEHGLEST